MAVRPIDGDELLGIERLLNTDVVRKSKTASWLLDQVLYDIQAMPTLTPPNEWVSVEEKLPDEELKRFKELFPEENEVEVLVMIQEAYTATTLYWDGERFYDEARSYKVTHWMPLPAPPGKDNNVPTKAQNEPLTIEQLREMDGEPVWVEEVKHWALIDIEKGGQWDGVPFAIWAENGTKFTYNVESRGLHCYRRPPEGEA